MTFKILDMKENLVSMVRQLGYRPLGYTPEGELNCVRPLGADYPRLHLYIRKTLLEGYIFNLHLDQKRPSYGGETAHSGDYDGEVVQGEAARIKEIIG
ncbi:MAG: hypothetical protein HYT82_01635 [Candidatus Harrisonbacteria bacterium]|nr:hypothetical protein [Candidatus Harrisonbacteria bacterium]MBI2405962.1 hypothetical protein [Candidatus Harrisonbacteria bacterium]